MRIYKLLLISLSLIVLLCSFAYSADTTKINISSGKSGYLSAKYPFSSVFDRAKAALGYYSKTGAYTTSSAVHYEWFDISAIPNMTKIVSATLYKYHDAGLIKIDQNNRMVPTIMDKTNRVTLGKLLEPFTSKETYFSNGNRYKSQVILNKIDKTTNIAPFDLALAYNVTEIIQSFVNGEANYGFSFLGNYNSGSEEATTYYFSKSTNPPILSIEYANSVCGDGYVEQREECDDRNNMSGDGCSSNCSIERYIYVIPYMGDIDGNVSGYWFYFYKMTLDFFEKNKIRSGVSFYPGSMDNTGFYEFIFTGMYKSDYIELIQKGNNGDEREMMMDKLSKAEQRQIILEGRNRFVSRMQEMLESDDVVLPKTYDQIGGRVTNVTKDVLKELGYNFYFDVFLTYDLPPLKNDANFDVIQYGVSFTTNSSNPGRESTFKSTEKIIKELKEFDTSKDIILKINGSPVIPVWAHQQDFEDPLIDNKLDKNKWQIFTQTLLKLKNDSTIRFVTPELAYQLRHGGNFNFSPQQEILCEYANRAEATSENKKGSLAVYAEGMPDIKDTECQTWSGYGYSWTPENWNIKANLTLYFEKPVSINNFTLLSDFDPCWDRIWLMNSNNNSVMQIQNGPDNSCKYTKSFDSGFVADTAVVETCGWSWSTVDSVQMCGKEVSSENTSPEVSVCDWRDCRKGAVSISVDDSYTSCMEELDIHGYTGTFFLTDTSNFNDSMWNEFNTAFLKGHEIGTHRQQHICSDVNDSVYYEDLEANINDITLHTSIKRKDIISHAYPCGYVTNNIKTLLSTNWNYLSARGYHLNRVEQVTPNDFFNLNSFNSHDYPGDELEPPNYFYLVDRVESEGKWANLVFHVECDHDGVINYLPIKDIWVDTIGNIARYTKLRDAAVISEYSESPGAIDFSIISALNDAKYTQILSLRLRSDRKPARVLVDSSETLYRYDENAKTTTFNVGFPIDHRVRIEFN